MRKQDFWFSYKYHIVDTTELILPEGYAVATYPGAVHIQNDDYRFNLHYTLQDHKLIYTKEIVMVDPVIKKQQFKAWNVDLGLLKKFYRTRYWNLSLNTCLHSISFTWRILSLKFLVVRPFTVRKRGVILK